MAGLAVSTSNSQETTSERSSSSIQAMSQILRDCLANKLAFGVRFFPITHAEEEQSPQVWGRHQWFSNWSLEPNSKDPWIFHLQAAQPRASYLITTLKPRIQNRSVIQKKTSIDGLRAGEYGVRNSLMVLRMKTVFTF